MENSRKPPPQKTGELSLYLRDASLGDPRVLSLVIFQKLQNDLTQLEEELTPRKAGELIREGLDLLPGYRALPGREIHQIRLREEAAPDRPEGEEKVIDIRDAVDSLLLLWNDYLKTTGQL